MDHSKRSAGDVGRTVILPFAGASHKQSQAEREAISRVREISRAAKAPAARSTRAAGH